MGDESTGLPWAMNRKAFCRHRIAYQKDWEVDVAGRIAVDRHSVRIEMGQCDG